MSNGKTRDRNPLKLTRQESESLAVEQDDEIITLPGRQQEWPLHEQVPGSLTVDDVAEALTGEVTDESREEVEDLVTDEQEKVVDEQWDEPAP